MSKNKKSHIIRNNISYIIAFFVLIGIILFNVGRVHKISAVENMSEDDWASLAISKVDRNTKLSTPVAKELTPSKEFDILKADPAMSQKWDINQTNTLEAWTKHRATGSKDVRVCVIDTGVDVNHPDLVKNLWRNTGETGKDAFGKDKSTNGIDDDQNGYPDDVHGFNFVANNKDLTDHHGHGTHIAGIIGAEGGNGVGISGISPKISLIIAKYYDPTAAANNNLLNTVKSIRYCVAMGSHIINYSGGGLEPSEKEREAVAWAREKGILFVAAAGNEQSNSDFRKYFPADYDLDNIISVTAFDKEKNVLPTSNWGAISVDIAAPGKNIYSTLPKNSYGFMTGTSQATAVVTGVAALLKARFPDYDANRIIRHITETGDLEPSKLQGKTRTAKRLNAYRALAIIDKGTNATGSVTKNTAQMKSAQFSVNAEKDLTQDESSQTVVPSSLVSFGDDLKRLMEDRRKASEK